MAARAGDRESQESFSHDVDLVVHHLGFFLANVYRRMRSLPEPKKTRSNGRFIKPFRWIQPRGLPPVSGDLFCYKPIVREVEIECADNVVAIAPRVYYGIIEFVAKGVRITNQVQPVPRPAFAEL